MAKTRKYSYWEQRRARELYGLLVTAEESAEQLRQVYFMASRETEEEAIRIVRRFQLKNSLTEKEAFALLEKVRDPADIKAVMKQLKKNPKNAELVAEAEAPAYAARIRQLQAVQKGVDQTALQLFQTTKAKTDETLEYVARESYYREAFALDQQIGAAFPFGDLEPQDVQKILDTRWEGASYSERIWNNTQALADRVKKEMLVSVLTGKTNEKIAREIANDFGVSFNAARRLVRTEACYVSNQIQMEIYKRTGVKEYIYSAILDMRTSPVCRSLDGKRFKVKKAQVGKNYPPMHPWCRSTTIAAMPESLLERLRRTARDAFGKLIKVPASMTYEDWNQKIFRPFAIKSVTVAVPSSEAELSIHTIPIDIQEQITRDIEEVKQYYDIDPEVVYEEIPGNVTDPFQYQALNQDETAFAPRIVVNTGFTWEPSLDKMNKRILKSNFRTGILASKNTTDLLIHEGAHYKCFERCKTVQEYYDFVRALNIMWFSLPEELKHFNGYVSYTQDGAELLAEAAVIKHRGGFLHPLIAHLLEVHRL